jgi:C-methyltransferase
MTSTATVVPQPILRLRELAHSHACAAAIRAAARLGIPDAIGDEPATAETVAATVGADADATRRLLRALTCYEVFEERADGRFAHTDSSRLLREDAPRSLKYNALWATEQWAWDVLPRLDEAVRTGKEVFTGIHGKEFFEHLHADTPESAEVFDKAMTHSSRLSAQAIAQTLDLSGVGVVADIAGGQGYVLATLLEANPDLKGALLDLPDVVANPDPRLRPGGTVADRATLVSGDCRHGVPVAADVYILKNILEWDDESTVTTLRNVARTARAGAKVLVMENLVDGSPEMKFTTAMDLLLLLNVGGKKHTRAGLVGLVEQAGLTVTGVRPINSYLHLIESVVPA